MRRWLLLLLLLLLLLPLQALGQGGTATNVRSGATLPTKCTVNQAFILTTPPPAIFICTSPDTWSRDLNVAGLGVAGQLLQSTGPTSAPAFVDPIISQQQAAAVTAAWTSATSQNTVLSVVTTNLSTVAVSFNGSGTLTGGVLTFEITDGSGVQYPVTALRSDSTGIEGTYTLTGANRLWQVNVAGATAFQVRLSTVITGSGTVNVRIQAQAAPTATQTVVGGLGATGVPPVGNPVSVGGVDTGNNSHALRVTSNGAIGLGEQFADADAATNNALFWQAAGISGQLAGVIYDHVYNGATWDRTRGNTSGSFVQGPAASGASKAGNPVQVGGVFNTTQPTVTTGQTVEAQYTARGAAIVATGVDALTVGGTVTTTPPTNASTNVAQFGGVAVNTGTGASGTGTPRVTVANDSSILGTKTNNNAAPGATNFGVLPCLANAAAPTWVEGNLTAASCDLSGNLRTSTTGAADVVGTTGALNGLNATATVGAQGQGGVGMFLAAGTLIGTIVPEVSFDGGTTWVGTFFEDAVTGNASSSIVFGSSNTATSRSLIIAGGASQYRVRVSSFTSGTANCTLRASIAADPLSPTGAPGSAAPPVVLQNGGLSAVGGTLNANTVKSGSTAAVAGDTALVVGLHPSSPLPAGANVIGALSANQSTNVAQFGGTNVATGTGVGGAGVPRVTVSNDSAVVQGTAAATTAGWPVVAGNLAETTAAWTSATGGNTTLRLTINGYNTVFVTLNQGSTITGGVVTFEGSDTTGFTNAYATNCMQVNSFIVSTTYTLAQSVNQAFACPVAAYAAFQVRLSTVISGTGTVNVGIMATMQASTPGPVAAGSATIFYNQAVTTAQTVKSSAGNLYGMHVYNRNSNDCFLQFFNTTSPTLGTTTPILSIAVTNGIPTFWAPGPIAVASFATAIAVAATTGPQNGTTCSTGLTVNIWYQ